MLVVRMPIRDRSRGFEVLIHSLELWEMKRAITGGHRYPPLSEGVKRGGQVKSSGVFTTIPVVTPWRDRPPRYWNSDRSAALSERNL